MDAQFLKELDELISLKQELDKSCEKKKEYIGAHSRQLQSLHDRLDDLRQHKWKCNQMLDKFNIESAERKKQIELLHQKLDSMDKEVVFIFSSMFREADRSQTLKEICDAKTRRDEENKSTAREIFQNKFSIQIHGLTSIQRSIERVDATNQTLDLHIERLLTELKDMETTHNKGK
ncbi:hypothetical protein PROFUN_05583 [Planoprotostelium fungivorum]|uniref:Uncharacterized protein n=1 Tax=Planoprotostelium fungivorum TaxID=1890364 RepID=A0A2P6N049_9EUKA|nr:hypothetical protein PROFUN_05583 [Planoprotostelium fungivorum]